MLDDIKLMLGIEDDKSDAVLNLMLRDAEQSVLDYCHVKKLPPALESFVRNLVVQQFTVQNEGNIHSVKRGDTQTTYNEPIGVHSFTDKQKKILNAYRKWKAR